MKNIVFDATKGNIAQAAARLSKGKLVAMPTESVTVAPGEQITVAVAGEGPTIVLVPGLSGCCYAFRTWSGVFLGSRKRPCP